MRTELAYRKNFIKVEFSLCLSVFVVVVVVVDPPCACIRGLQWLLIFQLKKERSFISEDKVSRTWSIKLLLSEGNVPYQ